MTLKFDSTYHHDPRAFDPHSNPFGNYDPINTILSIKTSPLENRLDALNLSIKNINTALDELTNKLAPISRQPVVELASFSGTVKEVPGDTQSPVMKTIDSLETSLFRIKNRIDELAKRLDV